MLGVESTLSNSPLDRIGAGCSDCLVGRDSGVGGTLSGNPLTDEGRGVGVGTTLLLRLKGMGVAYPK